MKNKILVLPLAASLMATSAQTAQAVRRCEPQYGGGETCYEVETLILDKKIKDPRTGNYEDHVNDPTSSGYKFALNEDISFYIRLKNNGDTTINEIEITDNMPGYLFKEDFSFKIYNLKPGETQIRYFTTFVDSVPTDKDFECNIINEAKADWNEGTLKDEAKFCVTRKTKVQGITTLPKTGWLGMIATLAITLTAGFAGLLLLKLNRKP